MLSQCETVGPTQKVGLMTLNYTQILFDKFKAIYLTRWKEPERATRSYEVMLGEWFDSLKDCHTEQVRYALNFIKSGKSQFTDFPPNCIQFASLANSFRATSRLPQLPSKQKSWRDEMVDAHIASTWNIDILKDVHLQNSPLQYLLKNIKAIRDKSKINEYEDAEAMEIC